MAFTRDSNEPPVDVSTDAGLKKLLEINSFHINKQASRFGIPVARARQLFANEAYLQSQPREIEKINQEIETRNYGEVTVVIKPAKTYENLGHQSKSVRNAFTKELENQHLSKSRVTAEKRIDEDGKVRRVQRHVGYLKVDHTALDEPEKAKDQKEETKNAAVLRDEERSGAALQHEEQYKRTISEMQLKNAIDNADVRTINDLFIGRAKELMAGTRGASLMKEKTLNKKVLEMAADWRCAKYEEENPRFLNAAMQYLKKTDPSVSDLTGKALIAETRKRICDEIIKNLEAKQRGFDFGGDVKERKKEKAAVKSKGPAAAPDAAPDNDNQIELDF